MGNVMLMMSISLDGFIAGPRGELDWHLVDEEVHQYFNEVLASTGAFVSGRVMHELMADFWPTADQDPEASPAMVEYARIWRDKPKFVYSTTIDHADWNATILPSVDADEVRRLADQYGTLAVGGADLAAEFLRQNLVDEFRISIHPVVIGAGKLLLPPLDSRLSLRLVETRQFGNGVVVLHYLREV